MAVKLSSNENAETFSELVFVAYPDHAWVVYSGNDTQQPQAAFTNREYAEILVGYMQGAIDPVLREQRSRK